MAAAGMQGEITEEIAGKEGSLIIIRGFGKKSSLPEESFALLSFPLMFFSAVLVNSLLYIYTPNLS